MGAHNGVIESSGDWLISCVVATVNYAKSWFVNAPAPVTTLSKPDNRGSPLPVSSLARSRSKRHKKRRRRKALVPRNYHHDERLSKSKRLLEEYTTSARPYYSSQYSSAYVPERLDSARSQSHSESQVSVDERTEDLQSVLSIDSTVPDHSEYDYLFGKPSDAGNRRFTFESSVASPSRLSPFSVQTPPVAVGSRVGWLASSTAGVKKAPADLWVNQLRRKIQETLSAPSPASKIATPAYDRVCREQSEFEVRLEKAKQQAAFALPPNAMSVIAKAKAHGFTAEINNVPVTARDVDTLGDGRWLNDEVINFYMQLIMSRSEKTPGLPRVHAFNTFFYSTLRDQGYVRVKRWTRRIKLFEMDLVIVPVHLGVHWCCAVVDFRAKTVFYYDALLGDNHECLRLLMEYLREESKDKLGVAFDDCGWTTRCDKRIPQQMNGYDCGVFAITFAEYASRDAPFSFSQANCPLLRRRVTYEIATGSLLSGGSQQSSKL
ncbi:SUMO1 sentrin specific peptidase 1 [Coemansia aciculifera]|uniref:SUMO1 sentrin specific peptidase 1 n=1 Tax=Coemansia aciculifera TaxID=417176 RepID=A0ACC1M5B0_9FUNG|nr:SUMO1 sentrin specific peptidase 1 [Coemansia aciculifera]